jgi:hypothetical protein
MIFTVYIANLKLTSDPQSDDSIIYIQPAVHQYKLMDYRFLPEISNAGYKAAKHTLSNWILRQEANSEYHDLCEERDTGCDSQASGLPMVAGVAAREAVPGILVSKGGVVVVGNSIVNASTVPGEVKPSLASSVKASTSAFSTVEDTLPQPGLQLRRIVSSTRPLSQLSRSLK